MIQLYLKRTAQLIVWAFTLQLRARLRERSTAATIRASGLFDSEYYLQRYPDVQGSSLDPVDHYVRHGATELRHPHPLFDPPYYLTSNPDVAESGLNPLLHFVLHGADEERRPNPLFDTRYYLDQKPEVRGSNENPLLHYVQYGHQEDANPHPLFLQSFYQKAHPEVLETRENPLIHYLRKVESEVDRSAFRALSPERTFESPEASSWPPADRLPQLIAFYLPQFYPIPENDEWWGTGFTEWTNVSSAEPLYDGHDQPRIAGELGYYDLRVPETRARQAALAREYGIGGFCYYHYWFGGRQVLERPLAEVLESGEPDFPFCICWANENWTRRWDGLDDEILLRQEHSLRSDHDFIEDVLPILQDPRYITIDEKPLLLIYRPDKIKDPQATAEMWRDAAVQAGLAGLHLCAVQFRTSDPRPLGFDAAIEFPPHHFPAPPIHANALSTTGAFSGKLLDYAAGAANTLRSPPPPYTRYRGIVPAWDNTARSGSRATVLHGATPEAYEEWLTRLIEQVVEHGGPSSRFVFINAWNEWAEGAYLEPDGRHGKKYLEATARALDTNQRKLPIWTENTVADEPERMHSLPSLDSKHRVPLLLIGHDAAAAGSQYVLLELLACLREDPNFEPHLVLQNDGALLSAYQDTVETQVLGAVPEVSSHALCQLEEKITLLKGRGLQTAICNTVVTAQAAKCCKDHGLEVVSLIHEQPDSIEKLFGGRETMALVKEAANQIVVVSNFARDALVAQYGDMGERLVVLPPPLRKLPTPVQTREDLRKHLLGRERSARGDCLILGCGTLYARKGPDLFIELAREVARQGDGGHCSFVWVGGGLHADDVPTYNENARRAGVADRVSFVGVQDDMAGLLEASDIFALTSREDPFPLVNMEALSRGVPVVAFAGTGGAPELIEDDAGIVVPHLDVSAMARAVLELARNEKRRHKMGVTGRTKMRERFAAARYTEKLLGQLSDRA